MLLAHLFIYLIGGYIKSFVAIPSIQKQHLVQLFDSFTVTNDGELISLFTCRAVLCYC